ncbi:hypothetical protein ABFP60_19505 [Clostridioides difficile]
MVRWNIDKVKQYINENTETKLLSSKYVGRDELLKFKCKCGQEFQRSWRIFYRGSYECKKCAWKKVNKNRIYDISSIKSFVENNTSVKLLSKEYVNCKDKLKFRCECGNVFEVTFDNFKNNNKRKCNNCSMPNGKIGSDGVKRPYVPTNKTNNEFLCELKRIRGNEFSPLEEYISAKTLIRVKHIKCGYIWSVSPDHLLNRKDNCPYCTYLGNNSKGNREVSTYLECNGYEYEREKSFDDLVGIKGQNKLRFDFYLPQNNICIEYDGEQHYKPVKIFGGEEKLRQQIQNDRIKNNFCKVNNIKLIRVPYYELNNIKEFLDKAIMSQASESILK